MFTFLSAICHSVITGHIHCVSYQYIFFFLLFIPFHRIVIGMMRSHQYWSIFLILYVLIFWLAPDIDPLTPPQCGAVNFFTTDLGSVLVLIIPSLWHQRGSGESNNIIQTYKTISLRRYESINITFIAGSWFLENSRRLLNAAAAVWIFLQLTHSNCRGWMEDDVLRRE